MGNIFSARPFKNPLLVFITVLPCCCCFFLNVDAQARPETMPNVPDPIRPSKGVIIVVLCIMFTITFLLLAYVKFCRNDPFDILNRNFHLQNLPGLTRSGSRFSGIDKQVIEALPFFKFSSLKGSKEGLECAVCLSKFEDTEVLRLLPKCKHAFHINCIDKWLESHSSCPLCRHRVDAGDLKSFTYSLSSRFLRVPSNLTEDPNLEIFVQRERSNHGSSRFNIGSSFGNGDRGKKELLLGEEGGHSNVGIQKWKLLHKFNHKIVISDVVNRSRWSDLNSLDLLSLNSEMLDVMSSRRFSPLESSNSEKLQRSTSFPSTSIEEENSFTQLNSGNKRSMSEIANIPRFAEMSMRQNGSKEWVASSGNNGREERLRRIWLPIARRTVQWFARQERSSRELEHKRLSSNV